MGESEKTTIFLGVLNWSFYVGMEMITSEDGLHNRHTGIVIIL
jgi:hypothetical protein